MFLVTSCIEWGENLTFEIVNNTDQEIIFIRKGGIYDSDTTKLGVNESIIDISSEGSGNAISDPFYNCKTIILIYQDSIIKEYSRDSQGKNPLNIDSYKETYRNETKKQTSIDYEYLIEPTDFK